MKKLLNENPVALGLLRFATPIGLDLTVRGVINWDRIKDLERDSDSQTAAFIQKYSNDIDECMNFFYRFTEKLVPDS